LKHLGNAAHLLNMTPRDWDLVTVEEADLLLAWLDAYADEMTAQKAKLGG
jgi:hypothetical protein